MIWTPLNSAIESNSSFLLSSHQSLDGDCVGSQLAFLWYLKSRGKKAVCCCADPLPQKFAFLKDSEFITQNKPQETFDVLVILDCSNIQRLGWDVREAGAKTIINIDHHRDNTNFGDLNFVDPKAAAVGEVIFSFFKECKIEIPPHVAESLYTAVMTDTGGFRFSNTSSRVLSVCAELADMGVNCADTYEKVYSSHSREGLALQSRIWSTLSFHLNGKICSMDMPMSVLDEVGAKYSDSEGMADNTVTAAGVEVGVMTKHTPEETHFSLRSKGNIDVGKLAKTISGGGGHSCAAGCTIKQPYREAMEYMLSILEKELTNL
ncbi:MAG: bifunctional oligoribonuclease/PAP phosphatase NrnA [Chitinispirillales bacterium]|jgi:phosphoesterase RecJ-like protein|nr:bifunctional oligoribonuclease/PAP phosphatase NrnA [Chitinispirillales bacterium]